MESVFEFLFKYRPLVFENGRLDFAPPVPATALGIAAAVLALIVAWSFMRSGAGVRTGDRAVLGTLRLAVLAIALFCLFRPLLLVPTVVPQENWLGVLVDDSRSMRIADADGEPRAEFVRRAFGLEDGAVADELASRFRLRFFRFAESSGRLDDPATLGFTGRRTRIARALDRAREELSSVPLSGLVVVGDGADNGEDEVAGALLGLQAAGVPVFTVGVGRETLERDVELTRVSLPDRALEGSAMVADVVIAQNGFAGRDVRLVVEEGGRILAEETVRLAGDGEPAVARVTVPAVEAGARRYRFRVEPLEGELLDENNVREALVPVRGGREKILYFEGEPRFEVKFLRRAIADDENLQVVVLQRTAEDKYLRLDVDSGEELEGGFPATRDELFEYRGLVLGSVEASFFSHAQLEMIADFVDRRGGGLLVLGGRRALAEGGYAGTPLAGVLPVTLDDAVRADDEFFAEVEVAPTRAGLAHAALRLHEDADSSAARWAGLPALSTVNRVSGLKPGAEALLTGAGPGLSNGQPVLAHQRYGAGRSAAFIVQDSWLWQMHADVPLEDQTHERLWRQLLRWLVSDVPDRVRVAVPGGSPPGSALPLRAWVHDAAFLGVNGAAVTARIISPTGAVHEQPLEWTLERDGEYRGRFSPVEEGMHEVRIEAAYEDEALAAEAAYFYAAEPVDEYFDAGMRASLLRRIADETGGRFYTPATVASLPEDIAYTARGVTVIEEMELWDMPINFLLIVLLLLGEWAYRKRRGLA